MDIVKISACLCAIYCAISFILFPQFCPEHKEDHGPVVLSEKLSKTSRDFLRRHQDSKLPQGQTTVTSTFYCMFRQPLRRPSPDGA